MKSVSTEIKSVRNNIFKIEGLLKKVNAEFKLDDKNFHNVLVAVSELVLNAIVHGNKENPAKTVSVKIDFDDKTMIIDVQDEGNGFDFENNPDPTLPDNLFKSTGRGIFIVKSLMDNIQYKQNAKGTEFILTVRKK
jgi:serine/threonine-protein kinase RsbW